MGELFWNKLAAAVLGLILAVLLIGWFTEIVFHTESDAESFAYPVDLAAIQGGGDGSVTEEDIYDLGLLLASADASAGERVARRCTSCHTFEAGGGTLQGPNLHGIVGQPAAAEAGFAYSAAMTDYGQAWTYENLDHFIANPRGEVPGTAMSFAGLRNDEDRANLLAYLASVTPGAPAFPEPLPAPDVAEGDVMAEDAMTEDAMTDEATSDAEDTGGTSPEGTTAEPVQPGTTPIIENSEGEPTSEDPSETDAEDAPEDESDEN